MSARSFSKKWEENPKGLKGVLRPHEPLKPKISHAVKHIEVQIKRLGNYIDNYTRRDASLFEKIVKAYQKNETSRVSILSNELTEIRRHKKILMQNKLALDNIAIRLRTVFEFGNYVTAASPIIGILKNVRTDVSSILPEVGNELGSIETTLTDMVVDMGQGSNLGFNFEIENEASEKIIREAALIVESRIQNKLPDLPGNISQGGTLITKKDSDIE